jgi:isoleucyl-tRNA synthetase
MAAFAPVERAIDFPAMEERWRRFWAENDIFRKQLALGEERARAGGRPPYVFYEGPPTANGMPHPGHVLTRVVKDLFPRFHAMQGQSVPRKAGWDTHGLPVEIEVEKELGIEGKQGIEDYGVEPFVTKCRDSVFRYSDAWSRMTERIGFWIDLDDPYVTYHQSYVESVWWSLKQIWDAGLLYHGAKIVPWCPRCGTALSSHEVGLGYKEVADPSVYVGFRTKDDPSTLLLAWTTTPWTLLSNAGLAVGPEFDYDVVRVGEETLVMASALRPSALGTIEHEVVRTVKGSELVGTRYEPLFPWADADPDEAWRVVPGDFVGLDAGTGIVHLAPAFGEDDYRVGRAEGLPVINLVNPDGTFADGVEPWKGRFVKEADPLIVKDLRERNLLLKAETYKHDYPFCWRCDSVLLYYPRPAWYIATSTLKEKMLRNNAAVTWLPEHIQSGRFGNFLETNVDWALSRERYWGTPLPIWTCTGCDHRTAIGGRDELVERGIDVPADIDLHKPWVDAVELACPECGGRMRRVPEVIDAWYDSGSMPFAQWGYPAAEGSAGRLDGALPADFISEAIDQTRGWFYSLLAIATILKECAERKAAAGEDPGALAPWLERPYPLPYRRCLVLGHVCDAEGFKMSKSKGNYLDPWEILNTDGADAMRWYFYSSNHPWTSVRFFEEAIRDAQKDFLIRLRNVFSFFVIYANIDGFDPRECLGTDLAELTPDALRGGSAPAPAERPLLDRWMLSKLETATRAVTEHLEAMSILNAARTLYDLVDMLSNWYVRRSRARFWREGRDADKTSAYATLYECLVRIGLLIAPFTPFSAEELYQNLARALWPETLPESVHLARWPEADASAIDSDVERRMDLVREIASLGLAARAAEKIKVRQPLAEAVVILTDPALEAGVGDLAGIVREEINVKTLSFARDASTYVDYTIKPNFQALGPRLGKRVKACAKALAAADTAALVRELGESGAVEVTVEGEPLRLGPEELDIRLDAKAGYAASAGRGAVVVLETTITEALEREGLARELVSRVQGLRKELDLPFEARIALRIGTGGSLARAALEHRETIASETLATDLAVEFEDLGTTREFTIAGEPVRVSLKTV